MVTPIRKQVLMLSALTIICLSACKNSNKEKATHVSAPNKSEIVKEREKRAMRRNALNKMIIKSDSSKSKK